ncbi:MAG TPA: lipocalin family protein [Gemmatimonadales bacterium]|jgi:hypothetical protein
MPRLSLRSAALAIALVLASCGDDDGFSPTVENVSGSYLASSFTVTDSSGIVDLLASGASVQITLASDGATTGRLLLPGGDTAGDHDEDLTGTWALSGDKVTISPRGPSVLRFAEFTASPDQLTGERLLSGQTLRWVLTRVH